MSSDLTQRTANAVPLSVRVQATMVVTTSPNDMYESATLAGSGENDDDLGC
jgi:hypothetical protein